MIIRCFILTKIRLNFAEKQEEKVYFSCSIFTYVSPSLFESKEEDTLQAYLALNETRLLTALHDSITQLKQFSDQFYFDVAAVFNSLSHTYIQQRKLGALLSSQFWSASLYLV